MIDNELRINTLNCNMEDDFRDHTGWPRIGRILSENEPEPLY